MNGYGAAPMFAPDALRQLLPDFDYESFAHLVGLFSDITIMSLLALSAYLMLLVGRISFCQQAFFGLGAYAAGVMTAIFHVSLAVALVAGVAVGALTAWLVALPTMHLAGLHYAVATLAFGEKEFLSYSACD
jgi:branched-chain amino acid transport system permease protein